MDRVVQVVREEIPLVVARVLALTDCPRSEAAHPLRAVRAVLAEAPAAAADEVVAAVGAVVVGAAVLEVVDAAVAVVAAGRIVMCNSATGSIAGAASNSRAAFLKPSETRY